MLGVFSMKKYQNLRLVEKEIYKYKNIFIKEEKYSPKGYGNSNGKCSIKQETWLNWILMGKKSDFFSIFAKT